MLNDIIKELKNLKGKKVSVFGQPMVVNEKDEYIQAVDILEALKDYEVTLHQRKKILSLFEDEDEDQLEFIAADNTYNWNAYIDHDIQYHVFKFNGLYYVILKVHRYGDVRANYTDPCVLVFEDYYDFINAIDEAGFLNKVYTLSNDKEVFYSLSLFKNYIDVYDDEEGIQFECYDFDDIETEYNEIIKEAKESHLNA